MLNNHPNNPDSLLLFTKHQQSIDIWRVPTLASLRPWGVSNFETGTSGNLRMLGATWSNMSSVQNPMDVNSPLKSNEPDYINIYLCIYILYKYIYILYFYNIQLINQAQWGVAAQMASFRWAFLKSFSTSSGSSLYTWRIPLSWV